VTLRFARVAVGLAVEDPAVLTPPVVHGLVASWFDDRLGDLGWAEVGKSGHESRIKPYSVTPPYRADDGTPSVELRLLDDRLVDAIGRSVRAGRPQRVAPESVQRVKVDPDWNSSPEEVLEAADVQPQTIHFVSPTVVRHRWRGERGAPLLVEPLPEPRLIVGGLRRWWNVFGRGERVPMSQTQAPALDLRRTPPVVVSADIRTVRVPSGPEHLPTAGFVGSIEIGLAGPVRDPDRRALAAIVGLAPWSGCGPYTAWGMGVCEVGPAV